MFRGVEIGISICKNVCFLIRYSVKLASAGIFHPNTQTEIKTERIKTERKTDRQNVIMNAYRINQPSDWTSRSSISLTRTARLLFDILLADGDILTLNDLP